MSFGENFRFAYKKKAMGKQSGRWKTTDFLKDK